MVLDGASEGSRGGGPEMELCEQCKLQIDEKKMCRMCQDEMFARRAAFTAMTIEANEDAVELEDLIYADSF
jgi:recombinational DNA repair protein RecR